MDHPITELVRYSSPHCIGETGDMCCSQRRYEIWPLKIQKHLKSGLLEGRISHGQSSTIYAKSQLFVWISDVWASRFKTQVKIRTIWYPTSFRPLEIQTRSDFRSPVYFYAIIILRGGIDLVSEKNLTKFCFNNWCECAYNCFHSKMAQADPWKFTNIKREKKYFGRCSYLKNFS